MKKHGFTLIEMIVVIGVVALALPALFTVLFVVLQQQVKVYRLTEVKKQGDAVLQFIENKVRNDAKTMFMGEGTLISVCDNNDLNHLETNPNSFIFNWNDNPGNTNYFVFYWDANHTVQYFTNGAGNTLTKTNVVVDNYTFSCFKKNAYSPARIMVYFTICYKSNPNTDSCDSSRPEENASLTYRTTIQLRQ